MEEFFYKTIYKGVDKETNKQFCKPGRIIASVLTSVF